MGRGRASQSAFQILSQCELVGVGKLGLSPLQMKHVDGLVAFGRNQHELYVASVAGYHTADPMQQSKGVVGDDFQDRVSMRKLVVEIDDRRCPLSLTATVGGLLLSKQCGDIHASAHRLRQQRVQLRGCEDTEAICELEDVNHDRLQARECTAANDIEIEIRK